MTNNSSEGFDYNKQAPANTEGINSDTIYYYTVHDPANIEELNKREQEEKRKRFRLVTKSGWYYNEKGELVNTREEEKKNREKS
jgi:hypothetical protein